MGIQKSPHDADVRGRDPCLSPCRFKHSPFRLSHFRRPVVVCSPARKDRKVADMTNEVSFNFVFNFVVIIVSVKGNKFLLAVVSHSRWL